MICKNFDGLKLKEHCNFDCEKCKNYIPSNTEDEYYKGLIQKMNMIIKENQFEVRTIKIKYLKEGMEKILQFENGDWIDLRVAEDIHLEPNEFRLIPLGVAMVLPQNYEALLIPRSSTFKKYGIIQANSIGLIDETYCGDNDEWQFPAYSTMEINIPKNTRICQFRILKHQPSIAFVEADHLSDTDRGGIGSTGEK